MSAAAELIAELGWGRVTTRAVAERAGLPHGAVSYHFHGKQELLTEAAVNAIERAIPLPTVEAANSVDDLLDLTAGELAEATDPALSRLMMEAMREAERETDLRERLAALLGEYRRVIARTVETDQRAGRIIADTPADSLAALLAAAGDGLLLHLLLDPTFDARGAVDALRQMLRASAHTGCS
jgi:AcrR family transcriptional regulator